MWVRTINQQNVRSLMVAAWEIVTKAVQGGAVVIEIRRPSRSKEQNAKFHAMIADIAKTVLLNGQRFSREAWKALAFDAFEQELMSQGESLRNPSEVVVSLDKRRAVTVRASTTKLTKAEASQFIEFLYHLGTENGAAFSERSLAIYEAALAEHDSRRVA